MSTKRKCAYCLGTGRELNQAKVGRQMRSLRQSRKIGLRQLAYTMGFAPSYISNLEQGNRNWNSGLLSRYKKELAYMVTCRRNATAKIPDSDCKETQNVKQQKLL